MPQHTSANGRRSGGSRRKKKRRSSPIVPAMVLLSIAGTPTVVGYVLLSGGRLDDGPLDGPPSDAPDVRAIGAGGQGQVVLRSRETGRQEALIQYETWDPEGQGWYVATDLSAWVYLKSGEYVHLRADRARFYAPEEDRPRSGVLTGNVVARVFDAAAARPALEDPFAIEMRAEAVSFDTEFGRVGSDRPVAIDMPKHGIEFRSHDLRVVINQVAERIELLEVARGERITYTPVARGGETSLPGGEEAGSGEAALVPVAFRQEQDARGRPQRVEAPAAQPTPAGRGGDGARGDARAPDVPPVFYAARFQENVRLTQGDVSASGGVLDVWARTVDGRLPDGAIRREGAVASTGCEFGASDSLVRGVEQALATLAMGAGDREWPPRLRRPLQNRDEAADGASGEGGVTDSTSPVGASPESVPGEVDGAGDSNTDAGLHGALSGDVPMTLEWDGPMVMRAQDAAPVELRRNDVAARLTGGSAGGVTLRDASRGSDGTCASLEYGFTTQDVVIAGVGPTGVVLSMRDSEDEIRGDDERGTTVSDPSGTLRASRVEYSMATGVGRVPGAGTLEGRGFQRVSFSEQMDILGAAGRGGGISSIEEVVFRGNVVGEDEDSAFESQFAQAVFAPDDQGRAVLSSVFLDERVRVRGPGGERLAASSFRSEFEADGQGDSQPRWFEAEGASNAPVIATRPGDRLEARRVEGTLAGDEAGRRSLQTFEAQGAVSLRSREQGVEINGATVRGDVPAQQLEVDGSPERWARVRRGPTMVEGERVRLSGEPRYAHVYGPGGLTHDSPAASGQAASRFRAEWGRAMTFESVTGQVRAEGGATARLTEGSLRSDTIAGEVIEAWLEPEAPQAATVAAAPTGDDGSRGGAGGIDLSGFDVGGAEAGHRRLLRVVALGSAEATGRESGESSQPGPGESGVGAATPRPATIELRRYAAPTTASASDAPVEPALTQLLYIEGQRIEIDNEQGTMDVPGAGKLVVVDRRTPDEERESHAEGTPTDEAASGDQTALATAPGQPPAASTPAPTRGPDPFAGGSARGDALFDWQGSLHVERGASTGRGGNAAPAGGSMTMTDRVRMI
ncbi:MAG: hypothetical protein KDA05_09380, partial [Phycisphaerales bacterium]|nr:hypothetical protein [Phycisphaerales bacterium]